MFLTYSGKKIKFNNKKLSGFPEVRQSIAVKKARRLNTENNTIKAILEYRYMVIDLLNKTDNELTELKNKNGDIFLDRQGLKKASIPFTIKK